MIRCPSCLSHNHQAYGRNRTDIEDVVYRRHECLNCQHRFVTVEAVIDEETARTVLATVSFEKTRKHEATSDPEAAA